LGDQAETSPGTSSGDSPHWFGNKSMQSDLHNELNEARGL
jgi:hypothetical protein